VIVTTIQKVTQNINKMKKVRLKREYLYMTVGKVYDVISELEKYHTLNDDDGDERIVPKCFLEEVKEPNYVMVKEDEVWHKRILLHDLGEQFKYRYITVYAGYEEDFTNGDKIFCTSYWRYMKPINEVEQKIEELEQKLAELKQQINK